MKKFKILLVIFLLPITFTMYYLTSEKYGLSAYIDKQKTLDAIINKNINTQKKINEFKNKKKLLKQSTPDQDLLNEKVQEILGKVEKGSLIINIENL